ncbi:hypothetical protein Emag_002756 [Eimeria magna]
MEGRISTSSAAHAQRPRSSTGQRVLLQAAAAAATTAFKAAATVAGSSSKTRRVKNILEMSFICLRHIASVERLLFGGLHQSPVDVAVVSEQQASRQRRAWDKTVASTAPLRTPRTATRAAAKASAATPPAAAATKKAAAPPPRATPLPPSGAATRAAVTAAAVRAASSRAAKAAVEAASVAIVLDVTYLPKAELRNLSVCLKASATTTAVRLAAAQAAASASARAEKESTVRAPATRNSARNIKQSAAAAPAAAAPTSSSSSSSRIWTIPFFKGTDKPARASEVVRGGFLRLRLLCRIKGVEMSD